MKNILIVIISIICTAQNVCGQDFIENAVRSDGILPAEISKFGFNHAGNVDYHGDLNISIPVMTVPGRGGLDFPLTLSYRAGIKTTDKASWVGLGWSLETGSISRTVNGFPDFNHYRNIDYAHSPTDSLEGPDTYHFSVPGLGSTTLISLLDTVKEPDPIEVEGIFPQEWKNWKITAPSTHLFRNKRKYDCTSDCHHDVFGSVSTQLLAKENIDQILMCNMDGSINSQFHFDINKIKRNYYDYNIFKVYDERGFGYVFGLPLRSDMEAYNIVSEYVSNWRLTAILSPDYDNMIFEPNDTIGNWVRFEYDTLKDVRPYVNGAYNLYEHNRHALLTQMTYLKKIITPTHEAVFKMSPIWDISYLAPYANTNPSIADNMYGTTCVYDTNGSLISIFRPMRLDTILLYNRCGPNPILVSKTIFEYASPGNELCRYTSGPITNVSISGSPDLTGIGKLTLKKVYFTDYAGNIQPGYSFKYTDELDGFNPPYSGEYGDNNNLNLGSITALQPYDFQPVQLDNYYRTRTGRMGLLYAHPNELGSYGASVYNTKGAAAWSLRALQYPTGAIDTFSYESDSFDVDNDRAASYFHKYNWDNVIWVTFAPDECGIRVSKIKTFDPLTNKTIEVQYHYGTGHLPGLPASYLRNSSTLTGIGTAFKIKTMFDWSNNEVEYEWISKTYGDQSKTVDKYITAVDEGYTNQWITSMDVGNSYCSKLGHLVSFDKSWLKGKIKESLYYNSSHDIVKKDTFKYQKILKYSFTAEIPKNPFPIKFGGASSLTFLSETQTIHYSSNGTDSLRQKKEYFYKPFNGLLSSTIEYNGDSTERKTDLKYIIDYESHPLYDRCFIRNIITPVLSTSVWSRKSIMFGDDNRRGFIETGTEGSDFPFVLKSYSENNYKLYRGSYSPLRVASKKLWRDKNHDGAVTPNEMFTVFDSTQYDAYGNLTRLYDAFRVPVDLEWSPLYKYSKLTKRTKAGLTRSFTYNPHLLVNTITDENGFTSTFEYDTFGRLLSVKGPYGELLKSAEYHQYLAPIYVEPEGGGGQGQ